MQMSLESIEAGQMKIFEILFTMKPLVEESRDSLKTLELKQQMLEVRTSQIDDRLEEHLNKPHGSNVQIMPILEMGAFIVEHWLSVALILGSILTAIGMRLTGNK